MGRHHHEEAQILLALIAGAVRHRRRAENNLAGPDVVRGLTARDAAAPGEHVVALVLALVRVHLGFLAGTEDVNVDETAWRLEQIDLCGLVVAALGDRVGVVMVVHGRHCTRRPTAPGQDAGRRDAPAPPTGAHPLAARLTP